MEGSLWKWTNYLSGWQPRWFILDNGVLSYYKTQEEVDNGSKGSVNMSVCDVVVHPTDNTRLDLDIPGEAHFYVKASTAAERQKWLIALGSCKACSSDPRENLAKTVQHDELQQKKSELRLYCGELMTQIQNIKQAASQNDTPDIQHLNTASSLLTATCDTFIDTLESCMSLSEATEKIPDSPRHSSPLSPVAPTTFHQKRPTSFQLNSPTSSASRTRRIQRTNSSSSTEERQQTQINQKPSAVIRPSQNNTMNQPNENTENIMLNQARGSLVINQLDPRNNSNINQGDITLGSIPSVSPTKNQSIPTSHSIDSIDEGTGTYSSDATQGTLIDSPSSSSESGSDTSLTKSKRVTFSCAQTVRPKRTVQTFFSTLRTSFEDVRIGEDGSIPIPPFLEACKSLVTIFEKLGSTAFAPCKMDITGNVRKINDKYQTNPDVFVSLQTTVLYERTMNQSHHSSSATVALLWLRRGLSFLKEMLQEVVGGQTDLSLAVSNAYSTTLKPYHGWVIRGVFSIAVKAVPYLNTFIEALAASPKDFNHPNFREILLEDAEHYTTALDVFVRILTDFYTSENLETTEQI